MNNYAREIGNENNASSLNAVFQPFAFKGLTLKNRVIMSPMSGMLSRNQVPGQAVVDYYMARARGGVGMIVAGSTAVEHRAASMDHRIPAFFGEEALAGWKTIEQAVHEAGCRIMPQLFHAGGTLVPGTGPYPDAPPLTPSGLSGPGRPLGEPMTQGEIDDVVIAFANSASYAKMLGFDGVEIHGAHGFIIDEFFWEGTNLRRDCYGGSIEARVRFGCEIVEAVRDRVGPEFPIGMRISQWKIQDYDARIARDPSELERLLLPLVKAGVDMFHCSTRRFREAEFPDTGSPLNLAGWAKKITGLPAIAVGSVTLKSDISAGMYNGAETDLESLAALNGMLERGDFDLIAIARAILANPDWVEKVRAGRVDELAPYVPHPPEIEVKQEYPH